VQINKPAQRHPRDQVRNKHPFDEISAQIADFVVMAKLTCMSVYLLSSFS
jgi:hypothetical protein